jgi:6-phosphofructokinase 1
MVEYSPTLDFSIETLGPCQHSSTLNTLQFVQDEARVLFHSDPRELDPFISKGEPLPSLEIAGPRSRLFFEASKLNCGIVTCGGICPGLNDVIRAVVLSLFHHYGVNRVYGFQYGYEGLVEHYGHLPLELTPAAVRNIHDDGGTILGSSRGNQSIEEMLDTLVRLKVRLLFTIGGDGTLRGAQALVDEIRRRGLSISVIGIPKTIDNDIAYIERSFGFETAATEACRVVTGAHNEATSARNGVGLVRLMGRDSGFIAAFTTLGSGDVNFCLVPESPFTLEALLRALEERLKLRGHAVIVVAEGAGQELLQKHTSARDASGNLLHDDIGVFLRDQIKSHFKKINSEINLKYIDPSYTIRSMPATAHDSAFCHLLGQNAVHAGMTGRTNMLAGVWKNQFVHVPIHLSVSHRKQIDPKGALWNSVLSTTGQPTELV